MKKISVTKGREEYRKEKEDLAHIWREVVVDIFLPLRRRTFSLSFSPTRKGSMNLSQARIFARRAKAPFGRATSRRPILKIITVHLAS